MRFEAAGGAPVAAMLSLRGRGLDAQGLCALLAEAAGEALGIRVRPDQLQLRYELQGSGVGGGPPLSLVFTSATARPDCEHGRSWWPGA